MFALIQQRIPGLALTALCAGIAYAVSLAVPLLSPMLVAIIIGMIIRNIGLIPHSAEPGLAVAGRTVLRAGVVLLGLRLSIPQVLELGWGVVGVIVITVVGTYLITFAMGKIMHLGHGVTVLTATGTAICGAAAVAAMSAVVQEESKGETQEAAATAIASVTLFGTLGLIIVPWLGQVVGLSAEQLGVWVGAAIHEVGQVVAGAGIAQRAQADLTLGQMLVDTALVTKLGRVVLLAPLVATIGLLETRRNTCMVTDGTQRPPIIPLFVLGFLAMVLVRSATELPTELLTSINGVATILFTMAMVAMGAGVRLPNLMKTGSKSLVLGAIAGLASAVLSLAATWMLV